MSAVYMLNSVGEKTPFTVCSAVTVECCGLYPCCVDVFDMIALFSSVFGITERMDMGLYEVPLSLSGFGMGPMLTNFHMCGIMLVLRANDEIINLMKLIYLLN